MTGDEITGVLSCPECTKHREARFAFEHRFWRLSALMVECIGPRAHQLLPGIGKTWAEAFTSITGVEFAEAQARAMADRDRARAKRARQ